MRGVVQTGAMSALLVAGSILMTANWPVVADSQAAPVVPQKLTQTGLYERGRVGLIDSSNRAFSPQYALWSDGAAKARWVYLPPGSVIDDRDSEHWEFPVGARFWKEFVFNEQKVETRFLWRATHDRWIFASYIWNATQDEAFLASSQGEPNLVEIAPGRKHSIPSADDCMACHGARRSRPLGFNALQLSPDRDPNAIHAEAIEPGMLTLSTLVDERRLSTSRTAGAASAPRITTGNPRTRAVLGYLFANCGSCHDGTGEIAALGPVLKQSDLIRDGDAVARGLVGLRTKWQAPGATEGTTTLVDSELPNRSALLVRMRSRSPSSQMPPLGTVLRDHLAVETLTRWIHDDLGSTRAARAHSLQASHVR
jgi:hypothetical protein